MTIDRLNDDVLSEIFKWALDSVDNGVSRIWVSRTLSHVCSHWRRLAVGAPGLWNTFQVYLPPMTKELAIVETLLARSNEVSLNLCLLMGRGIIDAGYAPHKSEASWQFVHSLYAKCDSLEIKTDMPSSGFALDLGNTLSTLDLPSTLRLSHLRLSTLRILGSDMHRLSSSLKSCQLKHLWLEHCVFFRGQDDSIPVSCELPSLLTFHVEDSNGIEDGWIRGGLEVLESAKSSYRIAGPSLQSLDIVLLYLRRPLNMSNFKSVRRFRLSAHSPSRRYIAQTICGLPTLEELVLNVDAGAHHNHWHAHYYHDEDIPSDWSPPSLISIDFGGSYDFDDIARFLVAGTTTDILDAGSLKYVDLSQCKMSADLRRWITQRVPILKDAANLT